MTGGSEQSEHEDKPAEPEDTRDPAAVAFGPKGGLKGGRARAEKLTAERRSEIVRKASRARWGRALVEPERE